MNNNKSEINANTKLFCIFGNPVKHSLSPAMQNAAFKSAGLNAIYLAFEIDQIKDGISAMKALNISGASITIPFKQDVIACLDRIDPLAAEIGSVNTLHNANGKITGYNTDGFGALDAMLENDVKIRNSKVLIIGNGGSARAIAFTLLQGGAHVTIAGRNTEKISALIKDIKSKGKTASSVLINDLSIDFMEKTDIIINTTPIGMTPKVSETPLDEYLILKQHVVFDIVYSPDSTALLKIAKAKKCRIIRGIEMLVHQGAKQFEIWTGYKAPVSLMEKAVKKHI
jgi:shikimate dehydrogenase